MVYLEKQGAVRVNVQTLDALFPLSLFMLQAILSKLRKRGKYGFNSGIDRQIRAGIPLGMLPPLGPNLTLFRPANPVVFNLYIAGLSRKDILITQKEKKQDISGKKVEILTLK